MLSAWIWEFYERVEQLIVKLRDGGSAAEAEAVEVAIRGGATSGEILGRLTDALPPVVDARIPGTSEEAAVLDAWARDALRPR